MAVSNELELAVSAPPQLGAMLRHARLAKRLRLKDVALRAGCSESMMSKVENDKLTPSLALLHRIAGAIGTNISALLQQTQESVVTRAGKRPVFGGKTETDLDAVAMELLTPTPSPTLFQSSIHIIPPGIVRDGAIEHQGEDFGYVLEGSIELSVAKRNIS